MAELIEPVVFPPLYLPLLALLALVSFLYLVRSSSRQNGGVQRRLPPSPWALPVIGHLHHLAGALPHRAMRDLSRRHGPLMLLRLCELRVVVASSAGAAREMLRTHDLAFAGRPMTPTGRVLLEDSLGVIAAPYGRAWRQLRMICTLELLTARRVRSFGHVRAEEVGRLLRSLAPEPGSAPAAVNLSERIAAYVADSAVRAVIGSRFANRGEFLRLLERRMKLVPAKCLPDLFPSSRLAMLVSSMPRRIRRERREMMEFIDAIVREHQENRVAAGDDEDLLDVLLRIQSEGELDPPLTDDDIKTVIIDMFMAGSETSATLLQWAMAELVKNPVAMRKAQEEVRREVAGRVTEDVLGSLRYLGLVIKETLRLHPPATLILRECRTACRVLGFDVPAGAMVLVNAWAIGRDAASWGADAEEFRPERFDGSGVDFKGTDYEYIPLGAGRRMCPGVAFGLANVELALASLLYHFDWELPEPREELDMAEAMGLTTRRRSDLLLVPKLRVPLPC